MLKQTQDGYHPGKTKHIIRVAFRIRQCTRKHHLGMQKQSKIGQKGVFLVMVISFEKKKMAEN